jgi:hypothetical protein
MDKVEPATFTLDITGGNGTPFRFIYFPGEEVVRYYDRRYTLTEGEPGYGINHMNENGQCCGGALSVDTFTDCSSSGLRGWHEVDAWDGDRATMIIVGDWLELIMERSTREDTAS